MFLEYPVEFRPDGVRGILLLAEVFHGDDAARIHGVVGNPDFRRNTRIVIAHEITRIIVRDQGGRIGCEAIDDIVGIGPAAAVIEHVADSERGRSLGIVGYTFENECVETIVRVGVRTGQAFVEQQGQSQAVCQVTRERQGVVRIHAAIRLRPVKHVTAACARRGIS